MGPVPQKADMFQITLTRYGNKTGIGFQVVRMNSPRPKHSSPSHLAEIELYDYREEPNILLLGTCKTKCYFSRRDVVLFDVLHSHSSTTESLYKSR